MTEGFVDSASAYEVILALARRKPALSYQMEWDRALVVTAAFLNADHIKLAPSPKPEGGASGAYGIMLEGLEAAISRVTLDDKDHAQALSKTKAWAGKNLTKLRTTLAELVQAAPGCELGPRQQWVDAHISHEWSEHSRRHTGLFDAEFIPQLSRVLEVSQNELKIVLDRTKNAAFVENLARCRPDNDEFKLVLDCYVVSSLLRGRYHEYAAEWGKVQIVSHPIRRPIQKPRPATGRHEIEISNTERYLTNIVMASAFSESDHERRVARWVADVVTLRHVRNQINLEPKDRDETAQDVAVEAAKRFGIAPGHRILENVVDAGIAFGSTALTSFFLTPWESFLAGLVVYGASAKRKLGQSAVRPFSSSRRRLRKLSQLKPGPIDDGSFSG